ncbi:unnamed protein product [Sphagnum troendelagicum]|uniref:Phosphosulfolactate synthase n=1 Tax=Sphagnum jensenii TaxID=128206 RepID=A0ABP0WN20_9BRYO
MCCDEVFLWYFCFTGANERPQKPHIHGMTEVRGFTPLSWHPKTCRGDALLCLVERTLELDVLETMGQYMDGLKRSGCSFSLMPHDIVRQLINLAHAHDVYVSMGGWTDHILTKGSSIFKQYVQECKELGFDAIELNTDFIHLPEEDLLHLIRSIKSAGLKAGPELGIESANDVMILSTCLDAMDPELEGANWVVRRAECFLEASADVNYGSKASVLLHLSYC